LLCTQTKGRSIYETAFYHFTLYSPKRAQSFDSISANDLRNDRPAANLA
jgi:hypothetical protein